MPRRCPVCGAATDRLEMQTADGARTDVIALPSLHRGGNGLALDPSAVLGVHAYVCDGCGHVELVSARWADRQGRARA